jgi:hypothetical protein
MLRTWIIAGALALLVSAGLVSETRAQYYVAPTVVYPAPYTTYYTPSYGYRPYVGYYGPRVYRPWVARRIARRSYYSSYYGGYSPYVPAGRSYYYPY